MTAPSPLPPGHKLVQAVKTTMALEPGDSVRIAGLGRFAVAAAPVSLQSGGQVVVPLGWERLAIVADPAATWEARTVEPPLWQHRPCRACGGSGRYS
jgi:hypothetical protein